MKTAKIYGYGVLLGLVVAGFVGVFFLFNRMYTRDIKALENFVASYGKFDDDISKFSRPLFTASLDYYAVIEQLTELSSGIASSPNGKKSPDARAALTNEVMSRSLEIIDRLKESDSLEAQASNAQRELTSRASPLLHLSSLIKNDSRLGPQALEVAGLSTRELDKLISFKKALLQKMEVTITTLRTAKADNDGRQITTFLSQAKSQNQIGDLGKLPLEAGELTDNRRVAFTRFQNLGSENE